MIVVSDTTALTTLIKAGLDHLLPGLFGEVRIPRAVAQELLQFHPQLPDWCQVESAKESPLLDALRIAVDAGEAEAVAKLAAKGRYGVAENTATLLLRAVGEA